jgi:hypothetical protein
VAALLGEHLDLFHGVVHGVAEVDLRPVEREPSLGDPGHVQEIVDQAMEVTDVPAHHRALAERVLVGLEIHQLERRDDRRERVPELVPEERQERILLLFRLARGIERTPQLRFARLDPCATQSLLGDVAEDVDREP